MFEGRVLAIQKRRDIKLPKEKNDEQNERIKSHLPQSLARWVK
jgi:hypothetical protein